MNYYFSVLKILFRKLQELAEDHTEPASMLDIFKFAKPEHPLVFVGLLATIIRGCVWPVFSIIYGRTFKSLSKSLETAHPDVSQQMTINSICFAVLGLTSAIVTFGSGFLFGKTGERLTMRLRLESFKVSQQVLKI
jgi:hypothetical protein